MQQTEFRRPDKRRLSYRIQFQKMTLVPFVPSDNFLNCIELVSLSNYLLGMMESIVGCFDRQEAFIQVISPKQV
jgi:hypothetical protein